MRRYSGPGGYDEPFGVAVDAAGNIIVTGKSFGTRGIGLPDIVTVKYDANGNRQWVRRYYGGTAGHEEGRAVVADSQGNILVAGIVSSKTNNYHDAVLIKYSPSGARLWVRAYDSSFHDNDAYFAVAVDKNDNVFATGYTTQSGINLQDYLTVKYSSAGNLRYLRTYNGEESLEDWAESIAVDGEGNAIVTGSRGVGCGDVCYTYATIKYSALGVRQWVAIYHPQPASDNLPHAVKVDAQGNVYVTGQSAWQSAFYDFATIKYTPAGQRLWVRRFDDVGHGNDIARGLAVDKLGNVIVTGESYVNLSVMSNATTVKYGPGGARLWTRRYNGRGNNTDMAFFAAVDSVNAVYVSGFSLGLSTTAEDFVTIKYAP